MTAALVVGRWGAQQEGVAAEGAFVPAVPNRVAHVTTMGAGEVGLVACL